MMRKLAPILAAVSFVLAANAPSASAAVEILFCRGPLPYSLDINGSLTLSSKAAHGAAGQAGVSLPPGTCAFVSRGLSQPAPLVFRGPELLRDQKDLIRQHGMFSRVVSAVTAQAGDPTAVFAFFVDTDSSGKPTGVQRAQGNALNFFVSVSFSAVPKGPKFDQSAFRFDAPAAVLEKQQR